MKILNYCNIAFIIKDPYMTIKSHQSASMPIARPSRRLTQTALRIAQLPSAPTFDWTSRAAQALSTLHPSTSFAVVIAMLDPSTRRLQTESTGACLGDRESDPADTDLARCPLDRIGSTPIKITPELIQSGYITKASTLLPAWHSCPTSAPWNSIRTYPTIAAFVPLETCTESNNQDTPALPSPLMMLALARSTDPNLPPVHPAHFADTIAALTSKASQAICRRTSSSTLWLTQREQVILDGLIIGHSVRQIAESIDRSPHTVHDHVKNLHRKLDASSRGELIAHALGWRDPAEPIRLINPVIDPELTTTSMAQSTAQSTAHSPRTRRAELKLVPDPRTAAPTRTDQPQRPKATPLNPQTLAR